MCRRWLSADLKRFLFLIKSGVPVCSFGRQHDNDLHMGRRRMFTSARSLQSKAVLFHRRCECELVSMRISSISMLYVWLESRACSLI